MHVKLKNEADQNAFLNVLDEIKMIAQHNNVEGIREFALQRIEEKITTFRREINA